MRRASDRRDSLGRLYGRDMSRFNKSRPCSSAVVFALLMGLTCFVWLGAQTEVIGILVSLGSAGQGAYYKDAATVAGSANFTRLSAGKWQLYDADGDTTFTVRAGSGQAANTFEVLAEAGGELLTVDVNDEVVMQEFRVNTSSMPSNVRTKIVAGSSGWVTLDLAANSSANADIVRYLTGSNSILSTIEASGVFVPPRRSTEPEDCTASIHGAQYYDDEDDEICTCRNDGTDDEWTLQSDLTHATGHCSII